MDDSRLNADTLKCLHWTPLQSRRPGGLRTPGLELPFRYGYPDMVGNFHLVITQRAVAE